MGGQRKTAQEACPQNENSNISCSFAEKLSLMVIVIGLMIAGIVIGYILRERNLKIVHELITWAIFLLLFLLGITVGANKDVMDNLGTIGYEALLITLAAVSGSVFCAWCVYRFFFSSSDRK